MSEFSLVRPYRRTHLFLYSLSHVGGQMIYPCLTMALIDSSGRSIKLSSCCPAGDALAPFSHRRVPYFRFVRCSVPSLPFRCLMYPFWALCTLSVPYLPFRCRIYPFGALVWCLMYPFGAFCTLSVFYIPLRSLIYPFSACCTLSVFRIPFRCLRYPFGDLCTPVWCLTC